MLSIAVAGSRWAELAEVGLVKAEADLSCVEALAVCGIAGLDCDVQRNRRHTLLGDKADPVTVIDDCLAVCAPKRCCRVARPHRETKTRAKRSALANMRVVGCRERDQYVGEAVEVDVTNGDWPPLDLVHLDLMLNSDDPNRTDRGRIGVVIVTPGADDHR
jgi:hypothetical protein